MYKSSFDAHGELLIEFDPLRPWHAHEDSALAWPEYPYKQVEIDRVLAKYPGLTIEAAAGALLAGCGDVTKTMFELDQHFRVDDLDENDALLVAGAAPAAPPRKKKGKAAPKAPRMNSGWRALEQRFINERAAFRLAKRAFLLEQKQLVAANLDGFVARAEKERELREYEEWQKRQIVIRFDNGSKYDGDGTRTDRVLVPHGHGTLWVPVKEMAGSLADAGDIKRMPRYTGQWMNGLMHGKGTYYWKNGDTWEGNFIRDEMQGKGIYTFSGRNADDDNDDDLDQSSRDALERPQRVRFYDASQHVCWGDELVEGCRVKLFGNRHFGDPLVSVIKRYNVDLEEETECVIVAYDASADRFLVRKGETEETKWVSLQNSNFRVVRSQPIARLRNDDDTGMTYRAQRQGRPTF
ncbi:TPA: hypothetical protein N0F65_004573 [Lagenidium giganteum]|uniref:Uncharacterized protein n=1 Tax=Lagenidium giganteum TaxID=4803 RepID=A0AAV2Z8X7_9STRA|nr:TPA: hypothetical protein N0F65_004573 [Lagenidium giganteum]